MGKINTKNSMYMINKRIIQNFRITRDDLKDANDVFGTSIKSLKVKTVRKSVEHIRLEDQDFNKARESRKLQDTMGKINTKNSMYMINKRIIQNFRITRDDLKDANDVFGTSIKSLKVKTVRKSVEHIRLEIERIPAGFLDRYKNVTLTSEIMFVNKIRFSITISRHIPFGDA